MANQIFLQLSPQPMSFLGSTLETRFDNEGVIVKLPEDASFDDFSLALYKNGVVAAGAEWTDIYIVPEAGAAFTDTGVSLEVDEEANFHVRMYDSEGSFLEDSNTVYIKRLGEPNCAWASEANTDSGFVFSNSGTYANDPSGPDSDWGNDELWAGAINTTEHDIVEWVFDWEGWTDGYLRPVAFEYKAVPGVSERRLRLKMRETSSGSQNYMSGILKVYMRLNGVITGDELVLVLNDDVASSEYMQWGPGIGGGGPGGPGDLGGGSIP